MKKCSKCGVEKELSEFSKNKKSKDMLCSSCKECQKEYSQINKDKIKLRKKEYRQKNKDKIKLKSKEYSQINKDKINNNNAKWHREHRDKFNEYRRIKHKNDNMYNLANKIRNRFHHAYKQQCAKKTNKTFELVDLEAVYNKIGEVSNGYHIDHIIPISKFDLSNIEQLKLVYHPSNLQLLSAYDNLSKNDRIDWDKINCSLVLQKIARTIGLKQEVEA